MTQRETRSIRPWSAANSLSALRQEMNDLFENFFGDSSISTPALSEPKLDVSETENAVEVTADLPGFSPEEVHIDIRDNALTISGEHVEEKKEAADGGRKYHRIERRRGSFTRSVLLPCAVKQDDVKAVLSDGVLKITMHKAEEAKGKRIPVQGTSREGITPPIVSG